MCKMFAAAGQFGALDDDGRVLFHEFMSDLFRASTYDDKDGDASGFYAWSGDRRHHNRSAGDKRHIIRTSKEWSLMQHNPAKLYICHARGAMSDATRPENNHPFVGERCALMHEGWLTNHRGWASGRGLTLTSDTDSEFYMRYADKGLLLMDPIETMEKCLQITAMSKEPTALAFIDHFSDEPSIWFAKNDSEGNHEFCFFYIPRFNGVFLTSTDAMMEIAAALTLEPTDVNLLEIPEPFVIYQMSLDGSLTRHPEYAER